MRCPGAAGTSVTDGARGIRRRRRGTGPAPARCRRGTARCRREVRPARDGTGPARDARSGGGRRGPARHGPVPARTARSRRGTARCRRGTARCRRGPDPERRQQAGQVPGAAPRLAGLAGLDGAMRHMGHWPGRRPTTWLALWCCYSVTRGPAVTLALTSADGAERSAGLVFLVLLLGFSGPSRMARTMSKTAGWCGQGRWAGTPGRRLTWRVSWAGSSSSETMASARAMAPVTVASWPRPETTMSGGWNTCVATASRSVGQPGLQGPADGCRPG